MILALMIALAAHKIDLFIGTYTNGQTSRGIYRARFDTESGDLTPPVLAAGTDDPSALAISPDQRLLFAVHEESPGAVSAYRIGESHDLKLLVTQPLLGAYPCYVSTDRQGKWVFVACYSGGYVESLPVRPDGTLGPVASSVHNTGTGPNHGRQEASHMHWVQLGPNADFVYSCDLGSDKVRLHSFSGGEFGATEAFSVPSGIGPRHGAFSPDGHYFYVDGELGNTVTTFSVDGAGKLNLLQTLPVTPETRPHGTSTAEIRCHRNGKWVYVSNRGDDSVSLFTRKSDGLLSPVEIFPLQVKTPRWFEIDPTGKWLIAAGQDGGDLEVLAIDPHTGHLTSHARYPFPGSPVCLVFTKGS